MFTEVPHSVRYQFHGEFPVESLLADHRADRLAPLLMHGYCWLADVDPAGDVGSLESIKLEDARKITGLMLMRPGTLITRRPSDDGIVLTPHMAMADAAGL